jgi:hypothetical protein
MGVVSRADRQAADAAAAARWRAAQAKAQQQRRAAAGGSAAGEAGGGLDQVRGLPGACGCGGPLSWSWVIRGGRGGVEGVRLLAWCPPCRAWLHGRLEGGRVSVADGAILAGRWVQDPPAV